MSSLMLPDIMLLVLGVLVLVADLVVGNSQKSKSLTFNITWVGALVILVTLVLLPKGETFTYFGGYQIFPLGSLFKIIFTLTLLLTTLFSGSYFKEKGNLRGMLNHSGEFYTILCFVTLGMFTLVSSKDFLTLFVGLELATIPLYVLTGFMKGDKSSAEASTKYIIIGSVSTAIFLFGLSFIYGQVGSLRFEEVAVYLITHQQYPLAWLGILFLIVSIGFKLALAPFHQWAPDVYEGAPTPVTAFLSVGSKTAGIAVLVLLFYGPFAAIRDQFIPILLVLACITMVVGNLGAMRQTNLRRFMAYSSISQAGYLLVAFVGDKSMAVSSILFYLIIYAVSNFTVFFVIGVIGQKRSETFASLRGLSKQSPILAMVLAFAMFSLAGIPPLAGFTGKFFLFASAAEGGYYALIIFAALNSTVSLYYYLCVLKEAYITPPDEELTPLEFSFNQRTSLLLLTLGMLVLGLVPAISTYVKNVIQ